MGLNGIDIITPTSVTKTGTGSTATINAGGSVTFSACESLSLNGIFSSTYDNYVIDIRHRLDSAGAVNAIAGLRASGVDNTTANSYVNQQITADGTSVTAATFTSNEWAYVFRLDNTQRSGSIIYLFGPNIAAPTAFRSITASGAGSGYIQDIAGTHNVSSSYDGFSLKPLTAFSGLIKVYGLVK